ncbi:MAG: hypothetical protein E6R03_00170 [Hyphomicrobiaceae bacterium]|nr:MAG: hypothetical protein E6R03_00170 [Hyphomicrobiaceae bacterium]
MKSLHTPALTEDMARTLTFAISDFLERRMGSRVEVRWTHHRGTRESSCPDTQKMEYNGKEHLTLDIVVNPPYESEDFHGPLPRPCGCTWQDQLLVPCGYHMAERDRYERLLTDARTNAWGRDR